MEESPANLPTQKTDEVEENRIRDDLSLKTETTNLTDMEEYLNNLCSQNVPLNEEHPQHLDQDGLADVDDVGFDDDDEKENDEADGLYCFK